ncbi:MAG: HEAT repeat domain-containing protein, partial [Gammaproteobacteria bacterium]
MYAQLQPATYFVSGVDNESLVEQTLSRDPIQRYYAAKTMQARGPADPAFIPALNRLLQDEEFNVRMAACNALAMMGKGAVITATGLCHLLKDKTYGVRECASRALHVLAPLPKHCQRPLALALADFNAKVREHAAAALAASKPEGVGVAI